MPRYLIAHILPRSRNHVAALLVTTLGLLVVVPFLWAQVMQTQAKRAMERPFKVDIAPQQQTNRPGMVPIRVVLRDAKGQAIAATEPTEINVEVIQPSGQRKTESIRFAPGESSRMTSLPITELGLSKVVARHSRQYLQETSNYVLVMTTPSAAQTGPGTSTTKASSKPTLKKKAVPPKSAAPKTAKPNSFHIVPRPSRPVLRYAAFQQTYEPTPIESFVPGPRLMLKVSGENDGGAVRADGDAFARVQVFYIGSKTPLRDVQVWVQWSNGEISSNPIVIPKGQFYGEAHWTSRSSILSAELRIAATNPNLPFEGSREARVTFVEPILGIAFVNPPAKVSIVDAFKLSARFYDSFGNPISTTQKRRFRFATNNPILKLSPDQADVEPGSPDFSTNVLPTYFGRSRLEASIPGYQPAVMEIRIDGTSVLLLSLAGGLLGGLLGYINSGRKLLPRLITGVIVGLLATWAYVFVGLPNANPNNMILRTQISALFVSLIFGFSGVKAIAAISGAFNFKF